MSSFTEFVETWRAGKEHITVEDLLDFLETQINRCKEDLAKNVFFLDIPNKGFSRELLRERVRIGENVLELTVTLQGEGKLTVFLNDLKFHSQVPVDFPLQESPKKEKWFK